MRKIILLAAVLLAGCAPYDRNAAQLQGGKLPLDRGGDDNIGWVSGTRGTLDPRPPAIPGSAMR